MSRPGGFGHADIDVNLLSDPKLRAVRRQLPGSGENAVCCYLAVVLESWRQGERMTFDQALPDWLTAQPGVVEALVAEGLLDKQQRVPAKVWTDWYGVAEARREQRRSAGAAGGRAAAERRYSDATSDAGSHAVPDRQSSQTDRQTNRTDRHNSQSPQRARAREGGATGQGPSSIRDLLPPPPGHPEAEAAG